MPSSRRGGDGPAFCCYGCRIAYGLARAAHPDQSPAGAAPNTLLLRLGLGVFLTMNIMVFNWVLLWEHVFGPPDGAAAAGPYHLLAPLISYLLMLLCTMVMAALGVPLAADALAAGTRRFRLDADLLIVLGVLAAYVLSVVNTLRGSRDLYFDTAALILLLVTLGRFLDARARTRAMATATTALAALPDRVTVRTAQGPEALDVGDLGPGHVVRARAGEMVAVDGAVLEGRGHVNEATLTGESRPRPVEPGDDVLAGTISIDGQLWVHARRTGADTALAHMQAALERARLQPPPLQRVADRVAAIFIPAVVVLALVVLAWNAALGQPARGLLDGLSVLLISCPCALGLAAPLATWNAMARSTRDGILFESGHTIEATARIGHAFLDKTGTLTSHDMTLAGIDVLRPEIDETGALRIAAAVGVATPHPIGRCLHAATKARGLRAETCTDAQLLPGLGVRATVGPTRYCLGSRRLLGDMADRAAPAADDDPHAAAWLADDDGPVARFAFEETVRPDAPAALAALRDLGIGVTVLTGDRAGPARSVAERLQVTVHAGLLPDDKVAHVRRWRDRSAGRATVAMVGDGINDAPVLAAADVGIAMGSAADLARQAGAVHLTGDALRLVPLAVRIARHTLRRIRWNLAWAFGYNTIGLTLAAFGALSPAIAALAMLGSSLLIILTSRRAGDVGAPASRGGEGPPAAGPPSPDAVSTAERS